MGDTSETNTKVLYRELFLGVVALKNPIPQNHYLRDKVPFLKSGHTYIYIYIRIDPITLPCLLARAGNNYTPIRELNEEIIIIAYKY